MEAVLQRLMELPGPPVRLGELLRRCVAAEDTAPSPVSETLPVDLQALSFEVRCFFDSLFAPDAPPSVVEEIWAHSAATACAALELARRTGRAQAADEAFAAGLLHDVGRVALAAVFPRSYRRVLQAVRSGDDPSQAEMQVLRCDHATAGRCLARRWAWPASTAEVAWLHHHPVDSLPEHVGYAAMVQLVGCAEQLVRAQGWDGVPPRAAEPVGSMARMLGLAPARLEILIRDMDSVVRAYTDVLLAVSRSRENRHEATGRAVYPPSALRTEAAGEHRLLPALRRLCSAVPGTASLTQVLEASARAMVSLTDVEACVAYIANRLTSQVMVAWIAGDRNVEGSRVLSIPRPLCEALVQSSAGEARTMLAALPAEVEHVWSWANLELGDRRVWFVPLGVEADFSGGLLPAAPAEQAAGIHAQMPAVEALAAVVSRLLGFARVVAELDRAQLSLTASRRMADLVREDAVRRRSLAMVTEMAAGAAHELNNPLAVISGRAQMLLAHTTDEEARRIVRIICDQTQRAASIVTDLMQFAKPEPPQPRQVRLSACLEPIHQRWKSGSSLRDQQLSLVLPQAELTLFADVRQVEQILDALLANAVEATDPRHAHIEINSPSIPSDDMVRIVIRDNGAGMSREVLDHALDPFYSNRPAGRGRGLGLSRACRLAEVNGGRLLLESEPGRGTVVTVELPARERPDSD